MDYRIRIGITYFCCSTLPLLNGTIKRYLDSRDFKELEIVNVLKHIIMLLDEEYDPSMPRQLKKEYKRMIKLYRFRLRELTKWKY